MSEEPPTPPLPDPKPPLEYRNYSDDRPERRKTVATFIGGMVLGVIAVAIIGFFDAIGHLEETPHPAREPFQTKSVIVFGTIAVAAGLGGGLLLRPPRRRFMLAGFLLGVALTCIIEGICFFG